MNDGNVVMVMLHAEIPALQMGIEWHFIGCDPKKCRERSPLDSSFWAGAKREREKKEESLVRLKCVKMQ